MIKLIRKNVFETNSSSTHSISVGHGDTYDSITPYEDGIIYLEPEEFGWEQETYTATYTKLTYAYIYARDWTGDKSPQFMEVLKKVVCEHTGATDIKMNSSTSFGYTNTGYIDHQSVEDGNYHYLFEDEQTLKQFIFDPTSVLETDNDSH